MLKSFLFKLSLYTIGYLCATGKIAIAQVTPDGTTNTTVNSDSNGNFTIEQGDRAGDNLFHSFGDFSVLNGGSAFFNNATDISNIFSRVTGGNISNIDGLIGANGSANLFLINPAGILFGENASLDIGGSFYGSTADSILFESGEFSATNLDNPVLTINAPIGLNLRNNPNEIVNRSTADGVGLQVASEAINLIGGDINLEGGLITAPAGRIELGGLTQTGTVSIADDGSLSFPSDVIKGDVSLSGNAAVNITSDGGGLISVNANRLELTEGSLIEGSIGEGLGSENAVAGTIEINTTSFNADNNSLIHSNNLGTGQAGTVNITTDTLNFTNGSAITASTFADGDAGTINITARDISLDREFTGIYSTVGLTRIATEEPVAEAIGDGGEISVNTDNLSLTNGARIVSDSVSQGNAGNIKIEATGAVAFIGQGDTFIERFDGPVISGLSSQVRSLGVDAVGKAGRVSIEANSLTLIDKGSLIVNNSGRGDAGDIAIEVQDDVFLDREASILSQTNIAGNGGNINIAANSFKVRGMSRILADTTGEGDAGNINITANETISLEDGTKINNFVQSATGNGGNISLVAAELNLTNRSEINADTAGTGNAGNVEIEVAGDINLDRGSKIQSQTRGNAQGNAGNIIINAEGSLIFTNGSSILADSKAQGDGGNITITVGEQILLEGFSLFNNDPNLPLPSQIVAGLSNENAKGKTGGDITIEADSLVLNEAAYVSSNTVSNSSGTAGNIAIDVNSLQIKENSLINVFTGNKDLGGAITINARTIDLTNGGKILAATTGEGDAGNINLNVSEQIVIDGVESSTRFISDQERLQFLNDLQDEPSGIYANTTESSTGAGGNVNIGMLPGQISENFVIRNNGQIIASSNGQGSGGNISLKSQLLELNNGAEIIASTRSGRGGIIDLEIPNGLTLDRNSLISAQAFNEANGGNLTIDTNFIFAFPSNGNGNDIIASAKDGRGGNITIDAEFLFGIAEGSIVEGNNSNDINASSGAEDLDGTVDIRTTDLNGVQRATELPQDVVKPEQTTAICQTNKEIAAKNSFTIKGKGGIPATPELPLSSDNINIESDRTNPTSTIPEPVETSKGKIQPARGIKVTKDGIILTAYRTNNAGDRVPENNLNCGV